jgi:hypothetical protein
MGDNTLIKQAQAAAAGALRQKHLRERDSSKLAVAAVSASSEPFFDPLLRQPPSAVTPWTHSLMVIMPLMLGMETLNEEYVQVSFQFRYLVSFMFFATTAILYGRLHFTYVSYSF